MGLYTFLYGNPLYRLYTTGIQPPLLVTARLSRYTAHTAYTAIQPYTPYIIQRYTASLRLGLLLQVERHGGDVSGGGVPNPDVCTHTLYSAVYAATAHIRDFSRAKPKLLYYVP